MGILSMTIATNKSPLAPIIAIAAFVGCSASSPPAPLPVAQQSDGTAKQVAELQKRLAKAESQLIKQREAIIQLGGSVDWLRNETANAVGERWQTVRSPSARSTAESTIDRDVNDKNQ